MAYTTIDDPSKHFNTLLYTGKGDEQTIIGTGFKPDWIWAKSRSNSHYHDLRDSTRGVDERLASNVSDAASTKDQSYVSFDSDGFSLGDDTDGSGNPLNTVNTAGNNYVAWQWKANGGTTTTNDASATSVGSLDSVYQANTTAGFSIVTYTGAGGNQTIAHGLGAVPNVIIIRRRDDAGDWTSYHSVLGDEKYMRLNSTNGMGDQATYFNDTTPTSTVFTVGSAGDVNTSTGTHVAYCFTEIQGYSKFGSYTGNAGEPNGPFVYLGFKPAWLMIKASSEDGQAWFISDSKRDPTNEITKRLFPNTSGAEGEASGDNNLDYLSNGFRLTTQDDGLNKSGVTYIYMAFAESPFVTSNGTPNNAR